MLPRHVDKQWGKGKLRLEFGLLVNEQPIFDTIYFIFTNHVGIKNGLEYTDAIWVYWSKNLTKWNPANKAIVLDSSNCKWSKFIIGLPSVVKVGNRLAIFYDGNKAPKIPPGAKSHMKRDIGLAWLNLPIILPN